MELFSTMKENSHKSLQSIGRSLSNAQTLTSLCADISPNSSHFFEVIIFMCINSIVCLVFLKHHCDFILFSVICSRLEYCPIDINIQISYPIIKSNCRYTAFKRRMFMKAGPPSTYICPF